MKLIYPYEKIRSYADLTVVREFPPISEFFSTLKNENVSESEYINAKAIYDAMPVKTLLSFLKLYNAVDVTSFLEASVKMAQVFWDDMKIDVFKDCISLPSVTNKFIFSKLNELHPCSRFGLFEQPQLDLCQELYGPTSMVGGLATIIHRKAIAGETQIRNNPEKIVKRILGFDFNLIIHFNHLLSLLILIYF